MGILGDAVNAYGGTSHSSLQSFLDRFSDPGGRYVNTLDPLGLFDVQFVFQPGKKPTEMKNSVSAGLKRVAGSIASSAGKAIQNGLDSVTGGLFSSITAGNQSVEKSRKKFKKHGQHSFLEYLAPANLLETG